MRPARPVRTGSPAGGTACHQSTALDPFFCCLQNKGGEFAAPLTSFDWNELDPRRLGTASIDTTCTIWDVERGAVDTQLIAHDREVRRAQRAGGLASQPAVP